MAVSRMRKLQILAHRSAKESVVSALRASGAVHITEPTIEFEPHAGSSTLKDEERELAQRLAKHEHLRDFLRPHAPKRRKSLEAMLNPRVVLTQDELAASLASFDLEERHERVVEIEGSIRSAVAEIGRKESLAGELGHWFGLDLPLEEAAGTALVGVALVTLDAGEVGELSTDLAEAAAESELIEVSRAGASIYAAVLYLKSAEAEITPVLKRHNARWASLEGVTGRPEEAADRLATEAEDLGRKVESLREEAEEEAAELESVLVALDESAEILAKKTVEENFGSTRETFLVEGWIRQRDEKALREALSAETAEVDVLSRDPEPGEDVPVDLVNAGAVNPFEFVTTLYGRPSYAERDPTPLLAPFFIVFFGLCVSDGGYGVTLAALSFFLMTKMQPGGGRQLMKLLFMGGVSTAVVGAVTGGWFGIDPAIMPDWLSSVIVMNPLAEPMKMLNVVFVLGIVQIMTGLAIKMVADIKEGRWVDGILDQLLWIFFIALLVPLGYDFILGGDVPPQVMSLARTGALAAGLLVVVTGARKNRNPVMKVLGGVLKLYDVVGYFGDVLSYARLLALGLATGAIAMAINGVAEMAGGIPFVGPVAAVVVLVAGHLFNLAVNCLGGFVHSARLQYLEFFGKFFTGGGRAFVPFREAKKYSMVKR
jgi:V/A-type H+-transporting ATPase subunit I